MDILLKWRVGIPVWNEKYNMLRLKSFFLLMILLWAGVSPAPAVPAFSELRQMASFSPKEVLVLADSLYDEVAYPHYKLDYIKACAYFRLSMFTQALHTAEHAYNSVEIKSDSLLYSRIFMILAEASVFSYSIEKAARNIRKGKAYATASGNDMLMGNLMNAEGYLYRRLGLPRKAYECTLGAVNLLNEAEGEERAFHLSRAYGFLMRYYISDRKFQEAWQTGLIRNQVIGGLKPLHGLDNQCGYQFCKMAYLACMLGKEEEAVSYYNKYLQTNFPKTYVGQLEINDYLLARKDYSGVLSNAKAYIQEMDRRDTLNISYVRLLQQACTAYEAMGNYHAAYKLAKRRLAIQLSMRTNNERNYLMGGMNPLEEIDDKKKLAQMEADLHAQQRFLLLLVVLAGVLFCFLIVFFTVNRMLYRKTRKMDEMLRRQILQHERKPVVAEVIAESGKEKLEIDRKETEPAAGEAGGSDAGPSDNEDESLYQGKYLFSVFDTRVRREKLYLNYALGRDDFARIMGVDKNRFAYLLKEGGAVNLTTYMNGLRLEYSLELFKKHPDWPVSKIAAQSGIPNLSTFYRLFKEKYGTSPNFFRNQFQEQE